MNGPVDSTRASRDGHEFHEAWTARKALQLIFPSDSLVGIAVEGLHPEDQTRAAAETVEIADLVLYYGKRATFRGADTVTIAQFKYSVSHSQTEFRNSHAKKTIEKFAKAYRDHKKTFDAKSVREKLEFELITNRPIYPAFEQAIIGIAENKRLKGSIKSQADQFVNSCGLSGRPLAEFASKCRVIGLAGNLNELKRGLDRKIVDWSSTADANAWARLGALRDMIRDKAGTRGQNQNVIMQVDVLAALDLARPEDLLPCSTRFPKIDSVIEREQFHDALALITDLDQPLLIHSAGGVGKTVFLQSLARALSNEHEIVLFDCFAGGAYRAPHDKRHLPRCGLVQIANELACQGLCDPLLPGNANVEDLFRTFRRRLSQCVETLKTASPKINLVLLIDAIDNAAIEAHDRGEPAFPKLLLESIRDGGQIPGVRVVVACRSHRIDLSKGDVECYKFKLEPFSHSETESYLRARRKNVTTIEIQVTQARSRGNPRILEHLISSDRGLLDRSEIKNLIEVEDLLHARIDKALAARGKSRTEARKSSMPTKKFSMNSKKGPNFVIAKRAPSGHCARCGNLDFYHGLLGEARNQGHGADELEAFLAGLSVLPPPVPIDEFASALGIDVSAIMSFAADMAPLLERTEQGLTFRDEPTETLIRETYTSNDHALQSVATNLLSRQDSSVYSARALPELLYKLGDGNQLFNLAFDDRFPQSITSIVGKQNIQYSRLRAAVQFASDKQDYNQLVPLLVELSRIEAANERGASYIMEHPDLVVAAQDVDAMRRMFETHTDWQGARPARLAIANALSSDLGEAHRHAANQAI